MSQAFLLQPSQAVKEIAAGSLSPHYTSSQWNAAFFLPGVTVRQLKTGFYGPLPMATTVRAGVSAITLTLTYLYPDTGSAQSLHNFYFGFYMPMKFSCVHSFFEQIE